jgi:hypothetical protein
MPERWATPFERKVDFCLDQIICNWILWVDNRNGGNALSSRSASVISDAVEADGLTLPLEMKRW